ncbi:MAG TPA: GNAT family N-acetyltransferase [Terriglobales bacterium]
MIPAFETARLHLRPLELSDAAATQILFPHWDIVRHLNSRVPWPYPENGAHSHYRDVVLPAMARGDEWHWGLWLKDGPHHIIGAIGLMKGDNDNRGFWLGLQWQGKGLMTEATEAVFEYWFNTLGFPTLRVCKAVSNSASRRISEKNGMRVVATEEREYVSGKALAEIWEISAQEWKSRGQRTSFAVQS